MKSKGAAKTRHYAGPIKVMNVREVSAYLHVRPSTIYRLLKHNQIPAFSRGQRLALQPRDNRQLALSAGEARQLILCGIRKHSFSLGRTLVWRAGRAGSARRRVLGQGLDTRRAFETVCAAPRRPFGSLIASA